MNVWPLGEYDMFIGIKLFKLHHARVDCHHKNLHYIKEEGNIRTMNGIPRPVSIGPTVEELSQVVLVV